jgi:hypothetical protein
VTPAQLRKLALSLPETSEKPCYGTPGYYARKVLMARELPGGLDCVVRMTHEQRDAALHAKPKIFALTAHYVAYPWVIVHLRAVSQSLMKDLLQEAWRLVTPARASSSTGRSSRVPARRARASAGR